MVTIRLKRQQQSFAKQLLMDQKKLEFVEKLKQKGSGDQGPRIGRGFDSGELPPTAEICIEAS